MKISKDVSDCIAIVNDEYSYLIKELKKEYPMFYSYEYCPVDNIIVLQGYLCDYENGCANHDFPDIKEFEKLGRYLVFNDGVFEITLEKNRRK